MRSNVTGGGFYNSEPRNFNRGFGRGNPKLYQSSQPPPSPQPPKRGDLFIEAGQLAVEYLVSRGLLSSNLLPGKCQNGSSRNNNGEVQDNRNSQDREISNEGRSSASARPRAASPDGISRSRRSPNDQDLSSKYSRERRKYGASRSYSSDWSRENGRDSTLAEKETSSQVMEVDYEKHLKESTKDENSDVSNMAHSGELAEKSVAHSSQLAKIDDNQGDLHLESGAFCLADSGSIQCKDDEELPRSDAASLESKDDTGIQDKEQESQKGEFHFQQSEENNVTSTMETMDVAEANSSLTSKSLDREPTLTAEEKNISEIGHSSLDPIQDVSTSPSSGIPSANEIPCSNYVGDAFPDNRFSGDGPLDSAYIVNQKKSIEFLPVIDKSFSIEQRSTGFREFQMCSPVPKDRGEKRALEEDCMVEGTKKAKQWLSVAQSNEYQQVSEFRDKKCISPQEGVGTRFSESSNEACLPNVSSPQKVDVEPDISQGKEKQLFSSSYKTCDLNLMEASDMHENHGGTALLYPSAPASKKEAHIDVDLSMNNNFNFNNMYNNGGSTRKDVEIIDLESSSLEEVKGLDTSTRKAETGLTSMASFANNPQNTSDNPEAQDGYGFMISELLGNDVPNCSPVQPDMNPLHNDIVLPHGEGLFNEDDPIYMSLGEIPLTGLLRGWEQPAQERNPFEL